MFNLLRNSKFITSTKELKQYLILQEMIEGQTTIREISRKYGFSAGLVSDYVSGMKREEFLDDENRITGKGNAFFQHTYHEVRNELLLFSELFGSSLKTEELAVASVASTSGFALASMEHLFLTKVNVQLFSRGYEAVKNVPEAHYYVMGNIPAMRLHSFGIGLEIKKPLLAEKHHILGNPDNHCLCIIGEASVSASLYQTGISFGINALHKYQEVFFADRLEQAIKLAIEGKMNILIWEPFATFLEQEHRLTKLFNFPEAELFTQVLVRNTKIFIEKELQDVFENRVDSILSTYNPSGIYKQEIHDFLKGTDL